MRDQFVSIGVTVDEDDIQQTIIDGLPSAWETFLVVGEEKPKFERFWYEYLQEEGRIQSKSVYTKEENLALTTRMKKGKRHFSQKNFLHSNKKLFNKYFDNSKVRCYNYDKKGHYAKECKEEKNGKGRFHASTTIEDETP